MKWVTVGSFKDTQRAELAKWKLQEHSITVNLKNVHSTTIYGGSFSSISLQVLEKDASRATKFLEVSEFIETSSTTEDSIQLIDNYTQKLPLVGYFSFGWRLIILLSLLILTVSLLSISL